MRLILATVLSFLALYGVAQKPLKEKDIQGSWKWTGMIDDGQVRPIDMNDAVSMAAMAGGPDHNWLVTFTNGNVSCMVCGGSYKLKRIEEGLRIDMEMICKRAGVQCFFSSGELHRISKDKLVLIKYRGQDNEVRLELTKAK